jgi:hypothetical protein
VTILRRPAAESADGRTPAALGVEPGAAEPPAPDPADGPTVYRITNAPVGLEQDQRVRIRNYVFSMGLRIVFILLAVVTSGYWRWAFALGAVFIPYFAVVIANGGRERVEQARTLVTPSRAQLSGAPPHDSAKPGAPDGPGPS